MAHCIIEVVKVSARKSVGWTSVSLVSLMVVGLPNLHRCDYADLYKRLNIGMTSEQVVAIAGPPESPHLGVTYQMIYSNTPVVPGVFGRQHEGVLVLISDGRVANVMLGRGGELVGAKAEIFSFRSPPSGGK
jgi:hypothetical protein